MRRRRGVGDRRGLLVQYSKVNECSVCLSLSFPVIYSPAFRSNHRPVIYD